MKISNLLKINIRENISAKTDRNIQKNFFYTIFLIKQEYGFKKIKIQDLFSILDVILKECGIFTSLNIKDILFIVQKYPDFVKLTKDLDDNDILTLNDNFRIDDILDINFLEKISNICETVFFSYNPSYLREKINEYKIELENFKQLHDVKYLITDALLKKQEISKKIADLINHAKSFIYLSISFYSSDLLFFTNVIHEKIKGEIALNSKIDFKIFYRPDVNGNTIFIKELKEYLVPLGYENFFKVYDKKYLKSRYKYQKIGNLHSKAMITDAGVLVGSANQTHLSLQYNFETAIYTNKNTIIEKAFITFNQIWEMFENPTFI